MLFFAKASMSFSLTLHKRSLKLSVLVTDRFTSIEYNVMKWINGVITYSLFPCKRISLIQQCQRKCYGSVFALIKKYFTTVQLKWINRPLSWLKYSLLQAYFKVLRFEFAILQSIRKTADEQRQVCFRPTSWIPQ